MVTSFVTPLLGRLLFLSACAFLLGTALVESETAASPSPSEERPLPTAIPFSGPLQPASVGSGRDSFTGRLHFPHNTPASEADAAAQFYCDVSATGDVEWTYRVVAKEEEFRLAVQSALDWGRFKPATTAGKPVAAYVAGTVLFLHRNGEALIVVSLATQDRERVGRLANYIQPQLVGGLRRRLEEARAALPYGLVTDGDAEVVVKVNEQGAIVSTTLVAEEPKSSGLGAFVEGALKGAQFTPAYIDGKPAAGEINVIVRFSDQPIAGQ
ncbi:MAG: hypothetical protein H0U99_10060 [Chthoniobacterales bacterium]|nr:hypothetical protein [Chthoniobacterales bacterium]